jgi:hypothetical protein
MADMSEKRKERFLISHTPAQAERSEEKIRAATPFATFTGPCWEETRARAERCLDRFASVGEEKQANAAPMIGLETREVAERMLLEASPMRADLPLRELAEVCSTGCKTAAPRLLNWRMVPSLIWAPIISFRISAARLKGSK